MSLIDNALLQMPTVRSLMGQIVEDLRLGRSVLGVLPNGVGIDELRSVLCGGLEHWHLYIEEVQIDKKDNSDPVEILLRSFEVKLESDNLPCTVENLFIKIRLPDVLVIVGYDELCEGKQLKWLAFLDQWAKACQAGAYAKEEEYEIPPALCILAQASKVPYPPPETNVLLSIRFWWGIPTTLEMQLMCQLEAEEEINPQSRWKQFTIPAIAGSDVELADFLWSQEYRSSNELANVLADFAQYRNWEQSLLEDWTVHDELGKYAMHLDVWQLSPSMYRAWSTGIVQWTPEYGLERHSAVLALLNRKEALDHRLWRGQAGFLLPKIDETRLVLCEHLNHVYGHDWSYKWQKPETDRELAEVMNTPYACQWGHLKSLMKRNELFPERRWRRIVNSSWAIRTELAHYRPIGLSDYENYYLEREKLSNLI